MLQKLPGEPSRRRVPVRAAGTAEAGRFDEGPKRCSHLEEQILRRTHVVFSMRRSLLSVLACIALGVSSVDAEVIDEVSRLREQSVLLVGADAKKILAQEWTKYDPGTLERREHALRRVRELGKRLAGDQSAGRSRECSAQIFLEAKWRAIYTADFDAIEQRIRDLETSLGNDDQAYATQQSPVEGSWGVCFEPMFMKLEATMLALQMMHRDDLAPKYALNLAPEVRTVDDAVALLARLLISDVAQDGVDHRSELAALTTFGAQFQFKAYWQSYLEDQVEGLLRDRDPGGSLRSVRSFASF
jgi:hypothetical protein